MNDRLEAWIDPCPSQLRSLTVVASSAVHKKRRVIATPFELDEEASVSMITIHEDSAGEEESPDQGLNPTIYTVGKEGDGPSNEREGSNDLLPPIKNKGKGPASLSNEGRLDGSVQGFNNAVMVSPHGSQVNTNPSAQEQSAMFDQMKAKLQNIRAELYQSQKRKRRMVMILRGKGPAKPEFDDMQINQAGPSGKIERMNLQSGHRVYWEDQRQTTPPGITMDD